MGEVSGSFVLADVCGKLAGNRSPSLRMIVRFVPDGLERTEPVSKLYSPVYSNVAPCCEPGISVRNCHGLISKA